MNPKATNREITAWTKTFIYVITICAGAAACTCTVYQTSRLKQLMTSKMVPRVWWCSCCLVRVIPDDIGRPQMKHFAFVQADHQCPSNTNKGSSHFNASYQALHVQGLLPETRAINSGVCASFLISIEIIEMILFT
jgi:hypothetical protein